jgi:hypothetical protein
MPGPKYTKIELTPKPSCLFTELILRGFPKTIWAIIYGATMFQCMIIRINQID